MSRARITRVCGFILLASAIAIEVARAQSTAESQKNSSNSAPVADSANTPHTDVAKLFQRGEQALNQGQLDEAERDFNQVLQINPQAAGAYANLGVVYMRRKQWTNALEMLEKAEKQLPQVPGIRLNIGLAYFRQSEFIKAIPPFESVVRDQPSALQPHYLLGLCYFFSDRWADAASTLEPLWEQESESVPYLYVLSNAAHQAGRAELDQRAATQMMKIGGSSAQYHLFAGKYHLNREEFDQALAEFHAAEALDPRLPFVHFNLGLAYLRKQEYDQARDEFLKDAATEPDLALNYEELGDLYWQMQDDRQAEASYREAIQHNPRLVNSHLGLAKILQRQSKLEQALAETTTAVQIDPERTDAHYMRARLLLRLGQKDEANREFQTASEIQNAPAKSDSTSASPLPSPELLAEPQ